MPSVELEIEITRIRVGIVVAAERTTCAKCGECLEPSDALTMRARGYCHVCRWLLRFTNTTPSPADVRASGMPGKNRNDFSSRQAAEETPSTKLVRLCRE